MIKLVDNYWVSNLTLDVLEADDCSFTVCNEDGLTLEVNFLERVFVESGIQIFRGQVLGEQIPTGTTEVDGCE